MKQSKKSFKKVQTAKELEVRDTFQYKLGIKDDLQPISKNSDIFADMTNRAVDLGLDRVLKRLDGRPLKVATMCSGTESPLLALGLVSEGMMISLTPKLRSNTFPALKEQSKFLNLHHLFSAEIVPFKQAYIERNFKPPIIYRDIRELSIPGAVEA